MRGEEEEDGEIVGYGQMCEASGEEGLSGVVNDGGGGYRRMYISKNYFQFNVSQKPQLSSGIGIF